MTDLNAQGSFPSSSPSQALTEAGLVRQELGDIASKIGQLYYNFYLRTSSTRFLRESYVFYEAIRSRHYFKDASAEPHLAMKQLRFLVRFIIVCLLLNRREVRVKVTISQQ